MGPTANGPIVQLARFADAPHLFFFIFPLAWGAGFWYTMSPFASKADDSILENRWCRKSADPEAAPREGGLRKGRGTQMEKFV